MSFDQDPWSRCSPADRKIIEELQGHPQDVPPDEVVLRIAGNYRDLGARTALVDGDREWTYEELGHKVSALGARLRTAGAEGTAENRKTFAVAIGRSAELVAATHAVALSGHAYCPLGIGDPLAWRSSIASRGGAAAVLVTGGADPGAEGIPRLDVNGPGPAAAAFEPVRPGADDLSQVIFTSGSTGRPKGVLCTHGGFANRIHWMQRAFELTPDDRVALKTPFTFDVAGWELFWPQYAGARTVVVPEGAHASPEALIDVFTRHGVTVTHFVPSMLRLWLQAGGGRRCPDLRLVFCSGEALGADLVEEFRSQSGARLHNLYGPTEASIDVTHFDVGEDARTPVPIGRPIANTRIYVLDEDRKVCPVGETGEIYINGLGVAAGYTGADAGENERFAPLGLPAPDGWRTFRTGDRGTYTPDGRIEFGGRTDDQVKIRGQRIELGELEAAVRSHPAVTDARARTYESGTGRLCLSVYAVVTPEARGGDITGEITEHLVQRLPSRSLPGRIVPVDELPLSAHGKVDRSRLPVPARTRPESGRPFLPPATRLEAHIAEIWARVLDLDEVGRDDNFHELGGDSMAAVEISFLIADRFGLDYDDDLVADILISGDTVATAAAIAAGAGIEDRAI